MRAVRNTVLAACLLASAGCEGGPERGLPPATAQEVRAARLLEEGRIVEAQAAFLQAAEVDPRSFLSSVGLARCAIAEGRLEGASVAFRRAYALAPRTPEARELLGRTHLEAAKQARGGLRRQHATTAASLFASASREAPELPALSYHAGLAELLAGRPRFALPLLEAAVQKDPESGDALHALVLAWRELGQKRRVEHLLEPLEEDGRLPPALVPELQWARTPQEAPGGDRGDR